MTAAVISRTYFFRQNTNNIPPRFNDDKTSKNREDCDNFSIEKIMQKLVIEGRSLHCHSHKRQLFLNQLVNQILRCRTMCRPLPGQELFGIYQEIYERVRQQLLQDVEQEVEKYNFKQMSAIGWSKLVRNNAFIKVLDDTQLKKLAISAQLYLPNTKLRRYALGELVEAIRLSGKLCHPHREKFNANFYQLLYEEAENETLIYVCENIDKYDPERGKKKFMNWVNFRLDKSVLECRGKLSHLNTSDLPSLKNLERIVQPLQEPSISEMVRNCLEEDAENVFSQVHIRNRPDANFRSIALARFSEKTWEEISVNLGITVSTLNSFFHRCCRKFSSRFKNYLQD